MNSSSRVLLLVKNSGEGAFLDSCLEIKNHLLSAYLKIFPQALVVAPGDIFQIAKVASFVDLAIYLDFGKPPTVALDLLHKNATRGFKSYVHLFGDFALNLLHWRAFGSNLRGRDVSFICLSSSQANLASLYFKAKIFRLDCPLASKSKSTPKPNRINSPAQFLYSGRLNPEKNILQLLAAFEKFSQKKNAHLSIAGKIDFSGTRTSTALFNKQIRFQMELACLPNSPITFLGHLGKDELQKYYLESDWTLALGTAPYEDYGVSVRESLLLGTKVLVSQWGGHNDLTLGAEFIPAPISEDTIYEALMKLPGPVFDPHISNYYMYDLGFEKFAITLERHLSESPVPMDYNNEVFTAD